MKFGGEQTGEMTPIMWSLMAAALCAGVLSAVAEGIAGAKGAVASSPAGSRWGPRWEAVALALFMIAIAGHGPQHIRDLSLAGLGCALAARLLRSAPLPGPPTRAPLVYATAGAPAPDPFEPAYGTGPPRRATRPQPGHWLSGNRGARMTLSGCALLLYAAAMQQHRTDDVSIVFGLVVVLLTIFAFGYRMIAGAEALGGSILAIAVAGYLATLGCMVVLGVGTASLLIAYGSLTLATSQLVLVVHRIVRPSRWSKAFATATSTVGLAAIMIGLVR